MLVSLYTSRVILNALGVVDYGIYNVVGGVVTMFSMLSGSLSAAISRFLTFELGKKDNEMLNKVFSSSITIQVVIALIIVCLAETIGLWFLNEKLVLPDNRMIAANWCFHFSIATFIINLISVPYNAAIIAHEKMSAFAYISILEAIGKLSVAFSIAYVTSVDKLILYGGLIAFVGFLVFSVYMLYCKRNFTECHYHYIYDHDLLKQMFGFAGWNFIGSSASILRDQGGNIVINIFCGPAVNAARGIATKVNSVVTGFVQNFMTALNPQIIKNYADGNYAYMMSLINNGARYSYYLLLLLSLPILLNTHYILGLWLGIIPDHTVNFIQLILVFALHESLANPLITAMLATGNIRKYQICAGGLNLMNLPVSYILLRIGLVPEIVLIVAIFFSFSVQAVRLYLLKNMINLSIKNYLQVVYLNVITVTLLSVFLPLLLTQILKESFFHFFIASLVTIIWTLLIILVFGLENGERKALLKKMSFYWKRLVK